MASPLSVVLYGVRIATLRQPRPSAFRLDFTPEAEDAFRPNSAVLSTALPIDTVRRPNGVAVRAFFAGLLPEGEARGRLADVFGVPRGDDYALLAAIGRDCAGAVTLLPEGEKLSEHAGHVEAYPPGGLERAVAELHQRPLGAAQDMRVSLPGVQDKLLLARTPDGRWGRPVDGAPSTHILKPQDMRLEAYAAAEQLCLRLAAVLDLTTVDSEVVVLDGRPAIIVARYDRKTSPDDSTERIHQEDAMQALGVDTLSGGSKYEAMGGPSLVRFAQLLRRHAPAEDLRRLLALTTLNIAAGNADAHAKNLSLLHGEDGSVRLAPAYDITPTTYYRNVPTPEGPRDMSDDLAMRINATRSIHQVTIADLLAEASSWGLAPRLARSTVATTLETLAEVLDREVERSTVPDEMAHFIAERIERLLAGDGASGTSPAHRVRLGDS
jgi:serine/threonine-protein kinase HipA